MALGKYLLRRIITSIVSLIVILTFIYFLFRLPAYLHDVSPVDVYLWQNWVFSDYEKSELIRMIRDNMGLPPRNASLIIRIKYFFSYLSHMLTFRFGYSTTYPVKKITPQIVRALPYSLILLVFPPFLSIVLAINFGLKIARDPNSTKDKFITFSGLIFRGIPVYWLAPITIYIFQRIGLYPYSRGLDFPRLHSIVSNPDIFYEFIGNSFMILLPILAMTLGLAGSWIYLMRNSILMKVDESYILTARAKGVDEHTILHDHAFRNAVIPFSTNILLSIPMLWTWLVFVEVIFEIPGLGYLLYQAIGATPYTAFDYATTQVLIYFIALTVILSNFLSDIAYGLLDPRVRYD